MGTLKRGTSGEVFAAWFVQAAIWGVPAAVLSVVTVSLLLVATNEPLLYWDAAFVLDLVGLFLIAAVIGGGFALPFVVIGGITAGITAVLVTWFVRPTEDGAAYSMVVQVIVGIVTTAVVISAVYAALFQQGDWRFSDSATTVDWLLWFGPLAVFGFGSVWLAGQTAVASNVPLISPNAPEAVH